MTKLATFSTKSVKQNGGTNLLSQSIRQSMARCSPRRETKINGAAGLLTSKNLNLKQGILSASIKTWAPATGNTQQPDTTLRTLADVSNQNQPGEALSAPTKPMIFQTASANEPLESENIQPESTCFDDFESKDRFNQTTAMTLDELMGRPSDNEQLDAENVDQGHF